MTYICTPLGEKDLKDYRFYVSDDLAVAKKCYDDLLADLQEKDDFGRPVNDMWNDGGLFLIELPNCDAKDEEEYLANFDGDALKANFCLWHAFPQWTNHYLTALDFPLEFLPEDSDFWEDEETLPAPLPLFKDAKIIEHWECRDPDTFYDMTDYDELFAKQDADMKDDPDFEPVFHVTNEMIAEEFN